MHTLFIYILFLTIRYVIQQYYNILISPCINSLSIYSFTHSSKYQSTVCPPTSLPCNGFIISSIDYSVCMFPARREAET